MNQHLEPSGFARCSLCKEGARLVNPTTPTGIPAIQGGGTCGSVASLTAGGCFDSTHCGFLQGYLKDKCCSDSEPGDHEHAIVPSTTCAGVDRASTSSILPHGADGVRCFLADHGIGRVCIEDIFDVFCFATLNNETCKHCSPGIGLCGGLGRKDSFRLDCSNVGPVPNPNYKELDVCPDSISYWKKSGGGGDDSNVAGTVVGVVFAFFLVALRIGLRVEFGEFAHFRQTCGCRGY